MFHTKARRILTKLTLHSFTLSEIGEQKTEIRNQTKQLVPSATLQSFTCKAGSLFTVRDELVLLIGNQTH